MSDQEQEGTSGTEGGEATEGGDAAETGTEQAGTESGGEDAAASE